MTETTPTTYVIPFLKGSYRRVTRQRLIDLIANLALSQVLAEDDARDGNAEHKAILGLITGASRDGEAVVPLNQRSDQELLAAWEDAYLDGYAALADSDELFFHYRLDEVPRSESAVPLAQQQRDTLTIEGMTDGETIEIGRDALIQRLVALRIDMAIRPTTDMQADTHAGYAEILRGGFKGFEHSGADELLETWRADRKEFYSRIVECLPLRIHESDPEWEDLANFDTVVDTTSTPLY